MMASKQLLVLVLVFCLAATARAAFWSSWLGEPAAVVGTCGDGVREGAEECDDGNTRDGDGCTSQCAVQEFWVCRDGAPSAGEDSKPAAAPSACERFSRFDRVEDISFAELIEKYYKKGLPVIITGAIKDW